MDHVDDGNDENDLDDVSNVLTPSKTKERNNRKIIQCSYGEKLLKV